MRFYDFQCPNLLFKINEQDIVRYFSFIFIPLRLGDHLDDDFNEGVIELSRTRYVLL